MTVAQSGPRLLKAKDSTRADQSAHSGLIGSNAAMARARRRHQGALRIGSTECGRAFKLQRVNRSGENVKASTVRLYLWITVGRLAGSGG